MPELRERDPIAVNWTGGQFRRKELFRCDAVVLHNFEMMEALFERGN
jgi:hypothetical protein